MRFTLCHLDTSCTSPCLPICRAAVTSAFPVALLSAQHLLPFPAGQIQVAPSFPSGLSSAISLKTVFMCVSVCIWYMSVCRYMCAMALKQRSENQFGGLVPSFHVGFQGLKVVRLAWQVPLPSELLASPRMFPFSEGFLTTHLMSIILFLFI